MVNPFIHKFITLWNMLAESGFSWMHFRILCHVGLHSTSRSTILILLKNQCAVQKHNAERKIRSEKKIRVFRRYLHDILSQRRLVMSCQFCMNYNRILFWPSRRLQLESQPRIFRHAQRLCLGWRSASLHWLLLFKNHGIRMLSQWKCRRQPVKQCDPGSMKSHDSWRISSRQEWTGSVQ